MLQPGIKHMVRQLGTGPVVDWAGLIHYVFSYDGMISIAFTACGEMLPDPATYADCIEAAYSELRSAETVTLGRAEMSYLGG